MVTSQQIIADARDNWDGEPIENTIMEFFNCREASIDDRGDVWIAEPMTGHWLSDGELSRLVDWMQTRNMLTI